MESSTPKFSTFQKFSELPIELRRKIWEYALQPRIVEFPHISLEEKTALWEKEVCFEPSLPQPKPDMTSLAVLGASYESNNTLQALYRERFEFMRPEADEDGIWREFGIQWMKPYRGVRFNPQIDTLSMDMRTCEALVTYGKEGLEPLQYAVVKVASLYEMDVELCTDIAFHHMLNLFLNAPNLKSITLVLASPDPWWELEIAGWHKDFVPAVLKALEEYWDVWRDANESARYADSGQGRTMAQRDRARWRSAVHVLTTEPL